MVRYRIGALLGAAVLIVTACSGSSSPSPSSAASAGASAEPSAAASPSAAAAPKPGGTLVAALPSDINRTDPALVDDSNSTWVENNVMEGLVGVKPGTTGEVIPVLAESWTISDDALTYTFKLREGVKFHDGTDFNADAVKINYDRWLNIPQSYIDAEYTYYIDTVIGHGAKSNVESVTVNSPTEVAIKLRAANSAFLLTQTLVPFAISSPKALTEGKASDPDFTKNTYAQGGPTAMTGTGPFKFKEWVKGDHLTIDKNPDYWDTAHAAYLDSVVFRVVADSTATLNALQASPPEVDIAQIVSPVDAKTAASDPNLQAIDRGSSCNLFYLGMNQKHKPFDNPKIREAVAYAINKQGLVDAFYGGSEGAAVADNWMPVGTIAYKPLDLPKYDPDKAKALIAESGVTDLAFDFHYPESDRPYAPSMKAQFESMLTDLEAVGFKPEPKHAPFRPTYLAETAAGKYAAWLLGWTCDWQGPDNFLNTAFFGYRTRSDKTFGPNEEYEYKNDAMWDAMDKALKTTDQNEAVSLWEQAQDLIRADIPSVPLVSSKPPAAATAYVKGFVPAGNLTELMNSVWLDK